MSLARSAIGSRAIGQGARPASGAITGTLAASEAGDTAAIVGLVIVQGALAASEAGDTAAISGRVIVQGALAASEAGDTFAAVGTVPGGAITGTMAASEAGDTAEISVTALPEPGSIVPGAYFPDGRPARALDLRRDVIYPPREPKANPSAPAARRSALALANLIDPSQQPGLL